METTINAFVFLTGLSLLIFAAEWLIQGCVKLSYIFKLTPLFIGLIVVAFGTSAPEGVVGITAAVKNQKSIALGTVLGSNIANIGLVLGLCALLKSPLNISDKSMFKREIPVFIGSAVLLYILSLDLLISRIDGAILMLFFIVFCFLSYKGAKTGAGYEGRDFKLRRGLQDTASRGAVFLIILFSLAGVWLGAHLMIDSGVRLAGLFGISPWVIGMIVFAIGTSLPELAASLAALSGNVHSISVGNIVGSNIFNILFVLGAVSLIRPIGLEASALRFELPVVLIFSFALLVVMKTGYRITRREGLVMFLGYVGFIILLAAKR